MKVIKKVEIPLQKCGFCGSIFEVTFKDLKPDTSFSKERKIYNCKFCKRENYVSFLDVNKQRSYNETQNDCQRSGEIIQQSINNTIKNMKFKEGNKHEKKQK